MSDAYIKVDADALKAHIEFLFTQYRELADDEELREGVFLGETDLDQIITRALDQMSEDGMMIDGIKARVEALSERSKRFERRVDAMRALIKSLMLAANLKSLPLPEASISISNGRQTVLVTNEADLPQGYTKTVTTPDKTAIAAALKAGTDIPGAELQTGEPTLTVRRK